ncbi:hypothetical protein J5N97_021776 [Dioscorea zingiberensis]|uniref:Peroxidase 1 n=1 Tax=Dioscorea zingiberensis TaxID=325984 RepID=A0A9D5HA05_9LILI|nr:hypothetical protein J5N97_021776 [Dioscorea zingiberensis]
MKFLSILLLSIPLIHANLQVAFYNSSCPQAESIVLSVVQKHFSGDPSITAAFLRMHFHDCLVKGCDASILIDSTKKKSSEKAARPNLTVRGFDIIDEAKTSLEASCPSTVSCADVIALATRDSVALAGGLNYNVPTGRRDGLVSNADDVNLLPGPSFSVDQALQSFTAKGLTLDDMVVLLGAHSVGVAHCSFFEDRLDNFQGTGAPDPTMDPSLRAKLISTCGSTKNNDPTAFLDQNTSSVVDNQYYSQIIRNKGVLQIDQELALDRSSAGIVAGLASDGNGFLQKFADALVKMGSIEILQAHWSHACLCSFSVAWKLTGIMEEDNALELLQRYRRDRRVLLNFILSGSLVKKVILPPGAVSLDDVDIDQVSIDYVLNCVKKGEMLDLSEAIRLYHDSLDYPSMSNTGPLEEFFLVTRTETSGSAPTRAPPPVPISTSSPIISNLSRSESFHSPPHQELTVDDIEDFEDEEEDDETINSLRSSRQQSSEAAELSLLLPLFSTGITDDDLRETAYEILVACAGAAGGLIVPSKEKKKERRSRLMRKLARVKGENATTTSDHVSGMVALLETMRAQLEISESMDIRTRQGLLNALVGRVGKRMDNLLVPLELLCCVSRTEFSDKKAYIRWQKRQLNMLEEGLINHPASGFTELGRKANEFRILLKKIEDSESLQPAACEMQRTECLRSLRELAAALAERPARGDLTGEVCHWADGYHLNVRLYEKMLWSVFDILDEGKHTEEVEEILELLRSTWRILGVTETIHDTCYTWVLFRQFVITGEQTLLRHVIEHLRKIPLKEQRGPQENLHLKGLRCTVEGEERSQAFTFLQSFLVPIQKWADKKLRDYHLHFSEGSTMMAEIVTVAMITRRLLLEESEQTTFLSDEDQIEGYVSSSVKSAFSRIIHVVDAKADSVHEHMLAMLAEESKKLLKKDSTIFLPVLSKWHSQAAVTSASLIHKLYGSKLRPFLDRADHLTEDVVSVFPAADSLEQYIMAVIANACGEDVLDDYCRGKISPYQVENISGTLVLRWVNSQLTRILGWVERTIQQETWDPISPQQRHGISVVEVYRIIEETVDQFFALKVPMRVGELHCLYRGLDNALQVYTQHVVDRLVSKEDLIPPVPALTRYRKELGIRAFVADLRSTDERRSHQSVDLRLTNERFHQIDALSTQSLCVRLNTLYYAITQLNKLEDSIQERWTRKKNENSNINRPMNGKSRSNVAQQKIAFDGSRKDINAAIDRICEFTGTKIIFWDLREPFIDNLYKHNVSQSRIDVLMESFDEVLNALCDIIVEPLRDRIVTGLLQASLDGFLRVILDGGPSRVFLPSDAKLLEEDLEILKEFFISGGDGLPRGTVENLVAHVRPVINLHSYESRVLIDDLRNITQGSRSRFGADSKTLLRILCHRTDSEASQFLKKQFKIPKSVA